MSKQDAPSDADEPPGEPGPFIQAVRELVRNPDSPASLRITSAVNRALAPSQRAVNDLVQALAGEIEHPGPASQADVQEATARWEQVTGGRMLPDLMRRFEQDARGELEEQRRRPPPLDQVLEEFDAARRRPDYGYQLGVDLEGLQGTWHRLWALLRLQASSKMDMSEGISTVRAQFEELLGRELRATELDKLTQHAAALAPAVRSQFEELAAKANRPEPESPS